MKRNIILVGFMGTGKSTVGRLVADRLRMTLLDMDDLIEERAGKSISRIFAEDGEPAFRRMESELARDLAGRQGLVVAAGGGVVLNPDNIAAFSDGGVVICLKADAGTILERVAKAEHRPLLEEGEKAARIRDLLAQRRELYDALPLAVDTTGMDAASVADRVIELYQHSREA